MATIGQHNSLPVVAIMPNGAYLDARELGEILLPNRYLPDNCKVEDNLDVFIYADSSDRLIATTETPLTKCGEFASLKVKEVNKIGAFLDWGLPKDLLVPYNQQHTPMEVGKYYLVYTYLDEQTERLAASSKLDKFIDIWPADYQLNEQVELIIAAKTELGFKAIINNRHWGLIFHSDVFQPLRIGKKITGYIKQIREDGRINLSLSRAGKGKVIDFSEQLLNFLAENGGFVPLHDKSEPALIQRTLHVSKKTFKATIGNLMKNGKLTIEAKGIRLK